jgi:hypothetical protein
MRRIHPKGIISAALAAALCLSAGPAAAQGLPPGLELGFSQSTFVSYQWILANWGAASLRLEANWKDIEVCAGAAAISSISPIAGWGGFCCDIDAGLAPSFRMGRGADYKPRIALGWAFVGQAFPAPYQAFNEGSTGLWSAYAQIEPLRFGFALGGSGVSVLVSALELRFGPLYGFSRPWQYNRGNGDMQCALLRLGLRFRRAAPASERKKEGIE